MFNYASSEVLVDTQWVADHWDNTSIRLVEGDLNSQAYDTGHIPGAVFWNAFTDLRLVDDGANFDAVAVEKLLSRSGITNDTTVIVYGEHSAIGTWIFWLLKLFGHNDVRVLDGGRRKWLAEERSLTAELPLVTPSEYHVQKFDASLRTLHENVQESIGRADCVLIDVRSPQEYSGEWFYDQPPQGTERAGHIPSAIHVPFELALNDDGTFRPLEELQALYNSQGITANKEAIAYCAVGARSSHTWFVLKYLLGYLHVRNYDGSWNEWSRLPNTPIEKL